MLAYELPVWLQWATDIAQILAAIGVIVALVQLKVSSRQFHQQLKATENQFVLSNQGYMKIDMKQNFVGNSDETVDDKNHPEDVPHYAGMQSVAVLENVGNIPVKYKVAYFKILYNGKPAAELPQEMFGQTINMLYPGTPQDYKLGLFYFNQQQALLSLNEVNALQISYKILINYYDYNSPHHKKTVNREFKLIGGTEPIWTDIEDDL